MMLDHKRHLMVRASALALLGSITMLAPSQSWAQDAGPAAPEDADAPAGGLGDIVVTASRREATTLSTPINISAIGGDELSKRGVTNFQDLSRAVAGLVYNSASIRDGGASSFIIHGLNLDGVSTGGERPQATVAPVSVYIGETPAFVNIHLADISRIEVLRGPQATLYGNASIAGTLRVLFNEPDPTKVTVDASGNVGATAHAGGQNYSFDSAVNLPITSNLAVRVAGGYTFDHGFIDAPAFYALESDGKPVLADPSDPIHSLPVPKSRKNVNDSELSYVRGMLKFEEGPVRLLATYQHQYEHSDGPDQDSYPGGPAPTAFSSVGDVGAVPAFQNDNFDNVFPHEFDEYETGAFIEQPLTRKVDLGSLEASYDFGFATLTSVTSAYETDSSAVNDSTAGYQKTLGYFYAGYPRILVPSTRDYNEKAFIQEVRLVSASDTPLTYSLGGFYMNQRSHLTSTDYNMGYDDYLTALGAFHTGTDVGYIYERQMRFTDLAAFGELTYHVTSAWQVTGGARVFRQKLDITAINALPICGSACSQDGLDPFGVTSATDRQKKTKVLFKVNTSYEFGNQMLAYFTFSQGVRRGGASGIPTTGTFAEDPAFQFYNPDSVDNYEVGLKGRVGRQFEFTAAAYWVDWKNPQVNVSTPNGGFPAGVNGSTARSLGVDLEAHLLVTEELSLNATYGFNNSKLTGPIVVGGRDYGGDGAKLPGTPHHTASVSANYDKPLASGLILNAQANVSYRSGISTSLTPRSNVDLPGFAIVGASIGISKEAWRLSLYGDNLADVRGVLSAQSLQSTDVRGINNRLSRPRTIGLRFNVFYR
ncbi:TonB-dependent receptor [Novosphingobium sp. AP12]|uniref:TonB-dependent receptor n=1 Tax=Novosphingobium sp. AP12 TaxID=1144305 RepID=UPI000271FAF3|nr:TonB-dependent receptor [Novosphingobium sp. AP12]EJL32976.1 outer membrane receptor protein [Novosphingobium sp. AP12]